MNKEFLKMQKLAGLIIQYNDPTEKESVISNLQPSDFDKNLTC